jgi:hypothetical protein
VAQAEQTHMYDDASNALPQYVIDLRAWLSDWYEHAFKVGYSSPVDQRKSVPFAPGNVSTRPLSRSD